MEMYTTFFWAPAILFSEIEEYEAIFSCPDRLGVAIISLSIDEIDS